MFFKHIYLSNCKEGNFVKDNLYIFNTKCVLYTIRALRSEK